MAPLGAVLIFPLLFLAVWGGVSRTHVPLSVLKTKVQKHMNMAAWEAGLTSACKATRSRARRMMFFRRMVSTELAETFFVQERAVTKNLMYTAISHADTRARLAMYGSERKRLSTDEVIKALENLMGSQIHNLLALPEDEFVDAVRTAISEIDQMVPKRRNPLPRKAKLKRVSKKHRSSRVDRAPRRVKPNSPSSPHEKGATHNFIISHPDEELLEESWRTIFFEAMVGQSVAQLFYQSHSNKSPNDETAVALITCHQLYSSPIWPSVEVLSFTLEEICHVLERRSPGEFEMMKRWFREDCFVPSLRKHFDFCIENYEEEIQTAQENLEHSKLDLSGEEILPSVSISPDMSFIPPTLSVNELFLSLSAGEDRYFNSFSLQPFDK